MCSPKKVFAAFGALALGLTLVSRAFAADATVALPVKAPPRPALYDWTGFYAGAHLGDAWGRSNWSTAPGLAGSFDLFQPFDAFTGTGSFFAGVQAGYNYMLPNRIVLGVEADVSFPSVRNAQGVSIGGSSTFSSPLGTERYSETVLWSGTVRGRIGYAPGEWLFYATGGFAWTYDQLALAQPAAGTTDMPLLWRLGWAAGVGVEAPVAPHWTARLEYLFADYGRSSVLFANAGQRFNSDFSPQELRAGLNYQFGEAAVANGSGRTADPDIVNIHGQTTFTWQGYPAFRSPYQGPNSLPGTGQGRETFDATLSVGIRLWKGAELWLNPEIDQGFGIGNTLGNRRLYQRRSLQGRIRLSLCANAARIHPSNHRSRRRDP